MVPVPCGKVPTVEARDHGEMLGARGAMGKGVFWDEAARVPLLVRLHGAAVAETPRVWRGAVSLDGAWTARSADGMSGVLWRINGEAIWSKVRSDSFSSAWS